MANYSQSRSDYLKIMMGDTGGGIKPYRPEQMNDLGDTSFDAAVLGDSAELIGNGADARASLAIARQRQRESAQAERQATLENQRRMIEEQQDDKGEWWQQVFGFIDNLAASWGTGWVKFYEGMLDLGGTIVSTIAQWAGNEEMSQNINNWVKKDLAGNFAEWTKTYANFTPWSIASNIAQGNYWNGDYWLEGLKSGVDIAGFEIPNVRGTEDLSSTLKEDTAKYYNFHSGYNTPAGEFLGGVVQSLGTVVASIYGFPNIGGYKEAFKGVSNIANKAINLIPFTASASGSGAEEALNDGAERADQALGYGLVSGAIEGATELASVGLEKIPGVGKLFTGEIHGLVSNGAKLTTSKFLANMFEEGFEEVEGSLLKPLAKMIYKGSSALDEYGTGEYWLNVGLDFMAGAASAGIMGAAQGAKSRIDQFRNSRAENEMVSKVRDRFNLSSDEAARAVLANVAFAKSAETLATEYDEAYEKGDLQKMKEVQEQIQKLSEAMDKTLNASNITDEDRRRINLKFSLNLQTFAEEITKITDEVESGTTIETKTSDTELPTFEDGTLAAKGTDKAPVSLVKEAADSREGDVFDMSSVNRTYKSVKSMLENALERAGIKAKSMTKAKNFVKNIFDAVNLGTDADKSAIRGYFVKNVLDMNVRIENEDGTKTTASLESVTTEEMRKQIEKMAENAFDEMMTKGKTSTVTKLINKIQTLIQDHLETKSKGRLHRIVRNKAQRIVDRYGHANAWLNQSSEYDFDHKGFQVLVAPFGQLEEADNGLSLKGKGALDAFTSFLENYKAENYEKKSDLGDDIVSASELWNQGLHDLAIDLVESIERDNRYEVNVLDESGKPTGETMVRYHQLDSNQLNILNQMLDIVREMPTRSMETRLENRSNAMSAKYGVEEYLTHTPGKVREFLHGYAERFASQSDTLMFEIGDNYLSKLFYSDLVRQAALRDGAVNDVQGRINDYRKEHKITESKLNRESKVVFDTNGNGVEMRYVETLYRHFLSGEESNNVKYINNDTVYIYDKKQRIAKRIDVTYSKSLMDSIKAELEDRGLLGYSELLHEIENETLRDVYDEDYLRDFHIANSNSLDNYTRITLRSNTTKVGASEVLGGVSNKNFQKDRVTTIPKGTHLVLFDGERSIVANAKEIYNTHFIDPVLKNINAALNSRLDGHNGKGETVSQYLSERKMEGAKTLMKRMVYGAYDVTPAELKKHRLVDGASTGWVMYVLGLNPSTVLKQPVSIMWSNDIKLSTVLKYTVASNLLTGRVFNNTNRLVKEIESEFPSLKLRKGRNEALMGNAPKEVTARIQKNIAKVTGFGINWADRWTVAHEAVGLLAYQGQELGYGEIGTPENDQYVKDHYVNFYNTQVSSNKILMSGARAGYYGPLGTLFSIFTGPAQGQVGYMLRAGQQIQQFKGKTEDSYNREIDRAKADEAVAKLKYDDAFDEYIAVSEADDSTANDRKEAWDRMQDAFDEYASSKGRTSNLELQAKSFKHFKEIGGTRGVVTSRLGSAVVSGVYLSLVSLLIKMLKGKHEWKLDGEDVPELAKEVALNSFVSWIPVVRNISDIVNGYDIEPREYVAIKQLYSTAHTLVTFMQEMASGGASEATSRTMLRNLVNSIGMAFGIPTENIYSYLQGILKAANPEAALFMRNIFYGVSNSSLTSDVKAYAEANDISRASRFLAYQYSMYKTGEIGHEESVEISKLIKDGYNPVARNVPDYYEDGDGEKVILSEDQRTKFKAEYSKANEAVRRLIASSGYRSMESEGKAKSIKKVYDAYYELAKYQTASIEPNSRLGKVLAFAGGDYDVAQAVLLIQWNAQLQDSKRFTKKEQAVRMVNRQPMNKRQRLLTLYLMGYGVSSENRKTLQNYLVSLGFTKKQAEEFLPTKN